MSAHLRAVDDLPPNDEGAERVLLGTMLTDRWATARAIELIHRDYIYHWKHQKIWDVIVEWYARPEARDWNGSDVAMELARRGDLDKVGGFQYVYGLRDLTGDIDSAAGLVAKAAEDRWTIEAGTRITQLGYNKIAGADPDDALAAIREQLDILQSRRRPKIVESMELDQFLGTELPGYDWLVPGVLERMDRLILTGLEGGGKSTWLRQTGIQLASGIHPFGGPAFAAIRVLLIDLENSKRQIQRKLHPIRLAAGDRYQGGMHVEVRPQGLDILDRTDAAWLRSIVATVKPDVLLTGPIYKLANGDPTEERTAKSVSATLDGLRAEHGCAIVLEAHSPYASNGGKRPTRPYGASLWSRWPEFGMFLSPEGELEHWRGPRDEREWPEMLQRGGKWPWTVAPAGSSTVWGKLTAYCVKNGGPGTQREMAEALSVGVATVNRAIKDHQDAWKAMGGK